MFDPTKFEIITSIIKYKINILVITLSLFDIRNISFLLITKDNIVIEYPKIKNLIKVENELKAIETASNFPLSNKASQTVSKEQLKYCFENKIPIPYEIMQVAIKNK